jgi:hypothetical protein
VQKPAPKPLSQASAAYRPSLSQFKRSGKQAH